MKKLIQMNEFEINYDLRPYLPDIFVKQNILSSFDSINNNNTVGINSVIFIININRPLDSIYNDPSYILFGIKKPEYENLYEFPPLNYYYSPLAGNKSVAPYRSEIPVYTITTDTNELLQNIGYDTNNIDSNQFEYQELYIIEPQTKKEKLVIWIYFNFKKYDSEAINYNQYASTIYTNNKYKNVIIYPFLENTNTKYTARENTLFEYNYFESPTNSKKYIETIDFDDREIIKYYEKLDWKYFENTDYTMGTKSDFETLKSYTLNIENYVQYIEQNNKHNVININLNEISKKFYYTLGYEKNYQKTYTDTVLNNKHINNYKVYSNDNGKYSMTMDTKIGNLSKIDINSKGYSNFDYDVTNNPTTYMQVKNYYLNGYCDIINYKNLNDLIILNSNLIKIFTLINPLVIEQKYIIDNVTTNISPLYNSTNTFEFGTGKDKLTLYLLGNVKYVDLYYIDKYKIIFEFVQDNQTWSYIIILSVVFYNSTKINILNTTVTKNSDDTAYINYTIVEESLSISPSINNFKNILKIYQNCLDYNINLTSKYFYSLDYKYLSQYNSQNNTINFINYFFLIPNIVTNLKTFTNKYYNNVLNVLMLKVNNYIKNFINVEQNYYNYLSQNTWIKNYICLTILYDENIIKKRHVTKCCDDCCGCVNKKIIISNDCCEENCTCVPVKNCSKCNNENSHNKNNYNYKKDPSKIKYIEYYSNFPKIGKKYLELDENFVGKYSQVLVYPNTPETIQSYEVIPAGKYLKFNYINYGAKYPNVVNEDFVKSIKSPSVILNYNFSLFVMLPYNINQDDNFYCTEPKLYWSSNYSMGIGSNKTCAYLVLTDSESNPYNFNGEIVSCDDYCYGSSKNPNSNSNPNLSNPYNPYGPNYCSINGIIYGIKLYNYSNYYSENLRLNIVLNLYMNNYINLSEFVILSEVYNKYTDTNNVLWNINESYLKLHNFNNLGQIVNYDFKRFANKYDKTLITEQYKNFNQKTLDTLYSNKLELNNLRYDIKISIYLSNLYKILNLLAKCKNYLVIIKINMMISNDENTNLISIIKYLIGTISNLFEINYNLSITSGTFETTVYTQLSEMYLINIKNNIENINEYIIYCDYIVFYSKNKIENILEIFNFSLVKESNLYNSLYWGIYWFMGYEQINSMIGNELEYDIDNFIKTTSSKIFDNITPFSLTDNNLLLEQVSACLKIIELNSTKIDELYNLTKLMSLGSDESDLNCNVTKNDYIYNTDCYSKCSNVPAFSVINFLEDMIKLIEKLSVPGYTSDYITYQKAILEGVITFGKNTIEYFKEILDKIVKIYNFIKNLPGPKINIFESEQVGLFYELLGKFHINYSGFFYIIYQNKINKFYEYDNLTKSFDNLFYSSKEFLFYVVLKNDFVNPNNILQTDIYVCEDLYKIIKTDTFIDFAIKTIDSIDNLVINKNPQVILLYLEKIKTSVINKYNVSIKSIVKKVIDEMIGQLKNNINHSIPITIDIIDYGSYYVLAYQDLLLFKGTFTWASFNFNKYTLQMINPVNQLNSEIFATYYTDPNTNIFYKQALNYTYLSTPFKYININNDLINE